MPDWLELEGSRALVAGGAGTIGAALAAGLNAAGARVAIVDRRAPQGDSAASFTEADLTDPGAAREAVSAARAQLGGLDVFIHCVGINDRRPIERYGASDWDRILAVNLTSAFHTATEAAVGMRAQGHGRIVFFSSVAGRSGHKHHGPYAATKGAINQLVAPGYMDTELTRDYLAANPDKRSALIELIPAGRFGTLEEVVGPVLFLCSPHASFITGQVLYIDGGRTIV